jgi:hypothetical protein
LFANGNKEVASNIIVLDMSSRYDNSLWMQSRIVGW